MFNLKRLLRIFGLSLAVLSITANIVFAGPTSPGAGSPTTPGALCLDDADTWKLCESTFTFGDTSARIAEIWATKVDTTTLVLGGAVTGPILNSDGTVAAPSYSFSADTNTGFYRTGADSIGVATAGAVRLTVATDVTFNGVDGNFIISGGTALSKGNIQFQNVASASFDNNITHVSNNNMTMGLLASSTAAYSSANGPFVALRGITYTAQATQRGLLSLSAGNPTTPATGEGEIRLMSGADVIRMVVDKAGVVYIPTPTTNRFVVGGTAALGAGGSSATIIGNTSGVGVLALQNTTAANAGYAQLDLYNSSGTNVAGFGYGNTATVAATQDRTYFYTVAKDFHISTDSNTTRHFVVAATSGRVLFTNSIIGGTIGVSAQITGSGTVSSVLAASKFSLLAGYTGASGSYGVYAQNQSAGTATDEFTNVQAANYGEYIATTTGTVVGQAGYASGGNKSYGGFFRSIMDKAAATNVGVGGFASNTLNIRVGGFFGIMNSAPTYESSALIADNGSAAVPIFLARDNGTTRFSIADGGVTSLAPAAIAGGSTGFTYTPGAHTAVTANVTDFSVAAHTMTITGGYASQIFSSFGAPIVTAASGLTLTNVANVNIEMVSVAGSALITNNSALFLGSPAAAVTVANIAGTHLSLLETGNQSFTLTAATQITNAIGVSGATFGTMTVNQSGGAVTVDNAATVYIAGALTAGASVTLTNNYALFVDAGTTRLDGNLDMNSGSGFIQLKTTAGITASTTQTQGQGALTAAINEVSTVANPNDTVTLPAAVAGYCVKIANNGANTLQIFPASGDNLGAGVNTSTTLTATSNREYCAHDTTNWEVY